MKRKIALFAAVALITALLCSTLGFADFGDYAGDSDWGGGSDWGGSDWDSDHDYDWGSSDYDYGYSGSSGGSIGGGIETMILIIIVVLALASVAAKVNSKHSKGKIPQRPRVNVENSAPPLVNDLPGLKRRDPGFSESKFLEDAANLYVRMQNAWTDKDLSPVETKLTAELYAKSKRQLESYIRGMRTNHIERIAVLNSKIVGCTKDSQNDIITVEFTARIVDYVTDDRSGRLLRGDPNRELFMTYRWTFIRTLGKTTAGAEDESDRHCPNCGAPLNLNQSAVCEYCGSVIESGNYDWVLSNIQGISQRS